MAGFTGIHITLDQYLIAYENPVATAIIEHQKVNNLPNQAIL